MTLDHNYNDHGNIKITITKWAFVLLMDPNNH